MKIPQYNIRHLLAATTIAASASAGYANFLQPEIDNLNQARSQQVSDREVHNGMHADFLGKRADDLSKWSSKPENVQWLNSIGFSTANQRYLALSKSSKISLEYEARTFGVNQAFWKTNNINPATLQLFKSREDRLLSLNKDRLSEVRDIALRNLEKPQTIAIVEKLDFSKPIYQELASTLAKNTTTATRLDIYNELEKAFSFAFK